MKKEIALHKTIIEVVNYYTYFQYAPTLNEIYNFLTIKTTKNDLKIALSQLVAQGKIATINYKRSTLYALPPLCISTQYISDKRALAQHKLKYIQQYIKFIRLFPQIQLVAVSGTISMMYAKKSDDVDLFVATAPYRLWTGRFICVIIASLMGLRRKRGLDKAPNRICLNMFFDGSDMVIPEKKRNLYTAHEVMQMKPLISKNDSYDFFLAANEWVYDFFPNANIRSTRSVTYNTRKIGKTFFGNIVENILKRFQLLLINRHWTTELITSTQLWFHPNDFEEKLRSKGLI